MSVFSLPQNALSGDPPAGDGIIIQPFTTTATTLKQKAILGRNAISLVLSGQKTMTFSEKTVHANDKEIHFLSAGHCIASIDISTQKEFRSILIYFGDQELTEFYRTNSAFIENARTSIKIKPDAYVSFPKDAFIHHYIESIQILLKQGGKASEPMKRIKLQELLLYLLENHPQGFLAFKYKGQLSNIELTIRKVVEPNLLSNLTIEEMAFLCNLSESTFKRQFKKIYSESPTTWILAQKMQLAAQMLAKKKEKPAEIWFKLGFETHSGFTKAFKKQFGVAPKDYAADLTFQD
jgi:AraC-like DNA-binding protein